MKKQIFLAILATLAAAGSAMADQIILPEYPDPKIPLVDETDGCYAISTAGELLGFAELINTASKEETAGICAKLTANITLNSNVLKTANGTSNVDENGKYIGNTTNFVEWTPIGTKEHPFLGKFNGKGHTIRGLYINDDSKFPIGLFGYVGNSAHAVAIDSLKLDDFYIRSSYNVGGLVCQNEGILSMTGDTLNGIVYGNSAAGSFVADYFSDSSTTSLTIRNSSFDGMVSSSFATGGLVGIAENLIIENSTVRGRVNGTTSAGGFAGLVEEQLSIRESFFEGSVTASSSQAGGFVGQVDDAEVLIENSASKGDVKTGIHGGSLIGYFDKHKEERLSSLKIINSKAEGNVESIGGFAGGLVGYGLNTVVEKSSFQGNVKCSGIDCGGLVGSGFNLTIKDSWSIGDVSGSSTNVGGLVGVARGDTEIENSYSKGNVKSGYPGVGGLVGVAESNLTIRGSFSEGDVQCENYYQAGGLVGLAPSTTIENSYAKGNVSAKSGKAGGLVGELIYTLSVRNSYYAGKVSASDGSSELGGIVGGLSEKTVVTLDNTFYLANEGYKSYGDEEFNGATAVSLEKFADGTVAVAMHDFAAAETDGETVGYNVNGKIWGQNLALETPDVYPTLAADGNGKVIFPIIAELNGGSVKEGVPNGYVYGEQVALPTPTREHYGFKGWFTDKDFAEGTEIAEIANTTVGTVNIYANWDGNEYTIAVASNDSDMGSVTGGGTYLYGTEVTLSAIAKDGYKFSNWEDDVNAAAERTIIVKGGSTFTANFEEIASSSSKNVIASSSAKAKSSSSSKNVIASSSSAKQSSSSSKNVIASSSSAKQSSSSSKNVIASSSSAKQSSSSKNVIASSSSAKQSSSSSKNVIASSSSAKQSSSSSKNVIASSSSAKQSSSSKGKDAIASVMAIPQFSVVAHQRSVQLIGAPVGARFAVFDVQGHVATAGQVESANFSVPVMRAGNYLVRVNGVTKAVKLK